MHSEIWRPTLIKYWHALRILHRAKKPRMSSPQASLRRVLLSHCFSPALCARHGNLVPQCARRASLAKSGAHIPAYQVCRVSMGASSGHCACMYIAPRRTQRNVGAAIISIISHAFRCTRSASRRMTDGERRCIGERTHARPELFVEQRDALGRSSG